MLFRSTPDIDNIPPAVLNVKVKTTTVTDMKELLAKKKVECKKQQAREQQYAAPKRTLKDEYHGEKITQYFANQTKGNNNVASGI